MASPTGDGQRMAAEITALQGLSLDQLRKEWRGRFGAPPPVRSADIVRRMLAERIQLEACGVDPGLQKELDRLVRAHERGQPLTERRASVRNGSVLVREWEGATHRVEVSDSHFRWNGRTYRSLSVIAREITGTRWNGPKFFGLREGKRS